MIVSYRDKRTRDFATGKQVKAFTGIERAARLRLDRLEAAVSLQDLAALRGNRLEALKGDRKGQHSIRINEQENPHGIAGNSPWRTPGRRAGGSRHEGRRTCPPA